MKAKDMFFEIEDTEKYEEDKNKKDIPVREQVE